MNLPDIYAPVDERDEGPAADGGANWLDLSEYARLLLRRWRVVASISVACITLGVVHYLVTPPEYRATTTIQIEQRNLLNLGGETNPWLEAWTGMKYYPTQYRLLRSRGLAERVVMDLRLTQDPLFNPAGGSAKTPVSPAEDDRKVAALANKLLGGLAVSEVKGTELATLTYVSAHPELAARVVNGVADAYIEWGIQNRRESVGKTSVFLAEQIDSLKRDLDVKEQELQEYSLRSDVVDLDSGSSAALQRLERLNDSLIAATAERLEKEARYRQLVSPSHDSSLDRSADGLIGRLTQQQLEKEREYETKLQVYKPDWPAMVALRGEIEEGRRYLAEMVAQEVEKARRAAYGDLQTAIRRERSLADEIDKVKAEAIGLGSVSVEYKNLEMEVENQRELLDQLLQRLSETGVSASLYRTRESNVRVVDRALVPGSPFRPSLRNSLTLGTSMGLLLGVGLVLLMHLLDRSIKSAEELERLLNLPVLVVIPNLDDTGKGYGYSRYYASDKGRKKGRKPRLKEGPRPTSIELVPESRPRIGISEAYRSLRTALLLSTAGGLRVVTITSAQVAEGKTATAVNLAVVMAQLGRRVLLVDADLRKARLHKVLEVSNRQGLVNFLTGSEQFEDCLRATAISNLTLCPSGPHPPNPSELLSSDRMSDLVQAARQQFHFVIIDSPPVLAVTDPILTGKLSDGVVLCFRADKILREDARLCRDRLRMAGVRILGTLLNRYQPDRASRYDRRYYYYYSHYEDYSQEDANVGSAA